MPRAEMLARMSSAELTEWIAFANLEPFGSEAGYLGHAIVASTIANVNRGKNKKAYKPEDFMPAFEKKQQTVDEMLQFASMMSVGLGGQDLRKEEE
jgi:hypothetical protein